MATTSIKTKIVKLSQAEYDELSTQGTLVKDGVTYTYEPQTTIYMTPDNGAATSLILTAPDNTQYRLVVANDGTLSTEAVA